MMSGMLAEYLNTMMDVEAKGQFNQRQDSILLLLLLPPPSPPPLLLKVLFMTS